MCPAWFKNKSYDFSYKDLQNVHRKMYKNKTFEVDKHKSIFFSDRNPFKKTERDVWHAFTAASLRAICGSKCNSRAIRSQVRQLM